MTDSDHPSTILESLQILQALCQSVRAFPREEHIYRPPIIDHNESYITNDIPGLSKFEALCLKELDFVEQLASSDHPPLNLSTNIPFLLSVWKEVLGAPRPITALYASFQCGGEGVCKVDVVSGNGRRWHKINTSKLSRVMVELHEQDSYLSSSSESDADSDDQRIKGRPTAKYPFSPNNSLTRQCYDMKRAAERNPLPDGSLPELSLRLTRLSGEEDEDPRLGDSYDCIRKMGVEVHFGEVQDSSPSTSTSPAHLLPTLKLNLDLSLLIALISDITHAILPLTRAEAEDRFRPVPRIWKKRTDKVTGEILVNHKVVDGELNAEEHSRALIVQLKQEMKSGVIEELSEAIGAACREAGVDDEAVEFWTTREASVRARDILTKIAGPNELARGEAMFAKEGEKDFWKGSRHEGLKGPLKDFKVRIYDDEAGPGDAEVGSFARLLDITCSSILKQEADKQKRKEQNASPTDSGSEISEPNNIATLKGAPTNRRRLNHRNLKSGKYNKLQPMRTPTAHTVRSMLEGARREMTTITANRLSVKQIVRNMGGMTGLSEEADMRVAFLVVEPKTLGEQKRADLVEVWKRGKEDEELARAAAIWAIEPRSLAEEMATPPITAEKEA